MGNFIRKTFEHTEYDEIHEGLSRNPPNYANSNPHSCRSKEHKLEKDITLTRWCRTKMTEVDEIVLAIRQNGDVPRDLQSELECMMEDRRNLMALMINSSKMHSKRRLRKRKQRQPKRAVMTSEIRVKG